jgi:DNA mismatch repair protein MutS2
MALSETARRAESHALEVLEFPRVLERIASLAVSEPGRRSVRALSPLRDPGAVAEALRTTDEMISLLLRFEGWSPPPIPDAEGLVKKLGTAGSVLEAEQLGELSRLLRASRLVRADLRQLPDDLPRLDALGGRMARLEKVETRVDRSLDPTGGLADGASQALARLRRSLRDGRAALVRRLERYVRQLPDRLQVSDASVTVRSGRYCVPIRREGLSHVGGIVHDESATHQTLFVEPPEAIEAMNRIAELEREEVREIQRVLSQLTELLRPEATVLAASVAALAEADSLYARARLALELGSSRPHIGPGPESDGRPVYRARDARHPLLDGGGDPVVPFHLDLNADERVLLISGPNAGGKTVLLKAVGLLSAMAQAGIVPPVAPGSRFPLFRSFFAVIGDEQSIQAALSTFSAQAESLREILQEADSDSLVLIDELGGSTDPAEGAALAAAVLLRLAGQAGLTVATTHLGELKDLAAEERSIVNASLQFDTKALRPTFRLVRDRPGRSYALEIARRLGLPDDVLEVARSRLSGAERRMETLLRRLEETELEMDRLAAETRASTRRSHETELQLTEAAERLARREREIEREAHRTAERYLLEARREVEREVERLRQRATRSETGSLDEAVRGARAGVEELLRESRRRLPEEETARATGPTPEPIPGVRVRSISLGVEGRVLEIREGEAVVDAGGLRFNLKPSDLTVLGDVEGGSRELRDPGPPLPEIAPATEVDLRGLRVDEVVGALAPALDAAVINDLPAVRIIHGKGTGALRQEVARILAADGRVRAFRAGGFQEGGSGVTVVEFDDTGD